MQAGCISWRTAFHMLTITPIMLSAMHLHKTMCHQARALSSVLNLQKTMWHYAGRQMNCTSHIDNYSHNLISYAF